MDNSTGTGMYGDRLPYESNGSGWMQQEDSAVSGNEYGGDFFADAQVLEYSPFDEEENPEQGEYLNEAGDSVPEGYADGMEMEECLPVGTDEIQDEFLIKEAQTVEGEGQPYIKEQDAEALDEESGQQDGEEPDADEISEEEVPQEDKSAENSTEKEAEEERKRAEHEASEAKKKAEWEARQQARRDAETLQMAKLSSLTDEELTVEAMKRIGTDTEKLTRRNMKDCVSEYIQTLCLEDTAFARLAMYPRKTMVHCFHYINRKAREFVEQEMKDNDIKPENGIYGSDVPDGLCYQWAEDYFRDLDAEEDREKEEKFVPKPYTGKTSATSKSQKAASKKAGKKKDKSGEVAKAGTKASGQKALEKKADDGQISFMEQMSFGDFSFQEEKVG